MNLLFQIFNSLINRPKTIDIKTLPSKGLFYRDDFKIKIKKASIDDIKEYETNYLKDLGMVIYKIKRIVESNLILSEGYSFDDLKSIDVIFVFLEIVRFTKGSPIKIYYFDEESNTSEIVEFTSKNFNYYEIEKKWMNNYNSIEKSFLINGYQYTLPSIGIENCLTKFLITKATLKQEEYNDYSYSFTYFLNHKNSISFDEIENLIQIFNFDLDEEEKNKVNQILNIFLPMQRYTLLKDNKVIEINSKLDLEKIWK